MASTLVELTCTQGQTGLILGWNYLIERTIMPQQKGGWQPKAIDLGAIDPVEFPGGTSLTLAVFLIGQFLPHVGGLGGRFLDLFIVNQAEVEDFHRCLGRKSLALAITRIHHQLGEIFFHRRKIPQFNNSVKDMRKILFQYVRILVFGTI